MAHQRAAERQHLPLTARQGAGRLAPPLPQPREDGKHVPHGRTRAGIGAQLEVLRHRHVGKQRPRFRHQQQAARHQLLYGGTADVRAVEPALPRRGQQAHDGGQGSGFTGTVGADQG